MKLLVKLIDNSTWYYKAVSRRVVLQVEHVNDLFWLNPISGLEIAEIWCKMHCQRLEEAETD